MNLEEAKAVLQGVHDRKMALANAPRSSRGSQLIADKHRTEAFAIEVVLTELSGKAG